MATAALLHLVRSQSRHHFSPNTPSVYHCFRSVAHGQRPITANPTFKTSQRKWASQATTTEEDNKISIGPHSRGQSEEDDDKESGIAYHGPISSTIKKVKLLSLSTCCLSVS
ncbi:putative TMEM70 family protein [Lupinus albus]|uniref:Putative TMEM70 family protein n=1 Tax=Lupinus albus TaxID=3870 RepID=A0A6A4R4Y4_LUPAL|nr:putative TMEM70 family protein [Lupinus albus]